MMLILLPAIHKGDRTATLLWSLHYNQVTKGFSTIELLPCFGDKVTEIRVECFLEYHKEKLRVRRESK